MVGARGFEPPASRTRTVRSTRLSYAPAFVPSRRFRVTEQTQIAQLRRVFAYRGARPAISRISFFATVRGKSAASSTTTVKAPGPPTTKASK